MDKEKLTKNKEFVNENIDKLINLYKNKYILVFNQEVVGSFDSYEVAAEEGIKAFGIGIDFLVHYVTENNVVNFVTVAAI